MTGGEDERRHRRQVVALSAVVTAFGLLTLATSGQALVPSLLFDGPSYLSLATHIRTHWFFPPPSMNLRPPLYPAVIAVAGWLTGSDGLVAVVNLQVGAWLLVGPLAALWVHRVGGSLLVGGLTGCLYYTLGESFLNVALIYAETITVALAVWAGLALSWSMVGPGGHATSRWLAAALAVATAHARPIYQLLVPLYAAFAAAPLLRRPRAIVIRRAMPFVVAALVGLLPFYVVNAVVKGSPTFVSLAGHSLADYLGDRRLLGKFPPGFEAVEALYATRFAADPSKTRIAWWEVAPDWEQLVRARTGHEPRWGARDREMGATAVAVLSRNPGYYLRRWLETWWEFSTTPGPKVAGPWCPITLTSHVWAFWWRYLGAWGPFVILALEIVNVTKRGRGEVVRLVPIVTYLTVALANTAIEPWPGQIRYRSQVEAFLLIAVGLLTTLIADCGRAALKRSRT